MIFHDRYELLALRGGDDREIALPGREISSGRDVLVHLLSAGYTPENQELLAIIDRLTAEPRRRVLDKGDHEGIPYVVTEVLPPNLKLREWLAAAMSAAPPPTTTASPARSGVWRIPAVSEAPPKSAPAPDTPALEPGEFTRLFEAVKELEQVRRPPPTPDELPTASMPMPKLDPKVPAAPAEPGEFTRIMRSAAPPSPATAAATQAPVPAEPQPGEFTRMLRSTAPPLPANPTATATQALAPAVPTPGEFTSILHSAVLQPPSMSTAATPQPQPAEIDAGAPAQPELGELTRVFAQTPAAPVPPRTSSAGQSDSPVMSPSPAPSPQTTAPGEFTRMMQSPLAAEPRSSLATPPVPSASEFTRMMQADQFADARAPQVPLPAQADPARPPDRSFRPPGEFTQMVATDPLPSESIVAPAAPQAPIPQGGIATGAFSGRAPPPPPQGVSEPSEFTQMFASRPPATEAKASAPKPASAAPRADKSYLPLVLILAGLLLLVVIVIAVFALTR
jgi:hypothetical protein